MPNNTVPADPAHYVVERVGYFGGEEFAEPITQRCILDEARRTAMRDTNFRIRDLNTNAVVAY